MKGFISPAVQSPELRENSECPSGSCGSPAGIAGAQGGAAQRDWWQFRDIARIALLICCSFLVTSSPAWAQLFTASLTGVVKDQSGAVIPNATVTLTDINKGFTYSATTGASGLYFIRNLPPSNYRLAIQAAGFKNYVQQGIALVVKQAATLNATLEVGSAVQTIQVSGTAPLINSENASLGQAVNHNLVVELPIVGRDVTELVTLAPGVTQTALHGWSSGGVSNNFISDGLRNKTADVLLDGVTVTSLSFAERNVQYTPSVDAIQEFKVEQNNFSADTGHTGSTLINMITRSGTNQFHGTAYEFFRNQVLDANNFFNNKNGKPLPPLRWNDFGGAVGGPIVKNNTFFFFDYEGNRQRTLAVYSAGVPSAAERNGDFGELCSYYKGTFNAQGMCSNPKGQLWDPFTGVYNATYGGPVRTNFIPFNNMATYTSPGNPKLVGTPFQLSPTPGNLINPVSQKIFSYFPLPNVGVGTAAYNPYNNWAGGGTNINNGNQMDLRIDHQITQSTQMFARYSYNWGLSQTALCWDNAMDPCSSGPVNAGATSAVLHFTHTFGPATVMDLSWGFIRGTTVSPGVEGLFPNFDAISALGLPAYMADSGVKSSPFYDFGGGYTIPASSSPASIGQHGSSVADIVGQSQDILGSIDRVMGHHEMKVGGEWRILVGNSASSYLQEGKFYFGQFATSEFPSSGGGDAIASMLIGSGMGGGYGSYSIPIDVAMTANQFSGYFQDNWRVTNKLTLNLGLRYDLDLPATERYNRLEYFNPNLQSPLQVPGLPNIMGGEQFVTPDNRGLIPNPYYAEWQPRFGFAYRALKNTVFRGGYGIFYDTSAFGPGINAGLYGVDGFQATTNWFTTYQGDGATPWALINDPFPQNSLQQPTGSSLGALTNVGLTPSGAIYAPGYNRLPYTQTWNFGLEQSLPANIVLAADYVGTKGTHLFVGGMNSLNYLGPQVEQMSAAQISSLLTYVPNPFYGIITNPASGLSAPTTQALQLQLPFPQYSGMFLTDLPWANSNYNALQIRVEKRLSHGLQFLATYSWSKSIDDASISDKGLESAGGQPHVTDPNNLKLSRGLSEFNIPQVFQFAYVWQLPFGRGRQWGSNWNKVVNGILGGWETTGIWRFDDGLPILLSLNGGTPIPTYGAQQPNQSGPLERNNGPNWMQQYFANPQVLSVPARFTLGNAPYVLPNIEAPGIANADLAIYKNFRFDVLREGMRLQFRLESTNALNHPQFSSPASSFNSGSFGQVTSQANLPRQVQLGLKLYF